MKFRNAVIAVVSSLLLLAVVFGLLISSAPGEAEASGTISYWYWSTLEGGTTSYISGTHYTSERFVGNYGGIELQVKQTGATTVTIAPQFSIENPSGCSSVTDWYEPTETFRMFVPVSPTYQLASTDIGLSFTASENTVYFKEFDTLGLCFRVKVTSVISTYTPTIYMRMLNQTN